MALGDAMGMDDDAWPRDSLPLSISGPTTCGLKSSCCLAVVVDYNMCAGTPKTIGEMPQEWDVSLLRSVTWYC